MQVYINSELKPLSEMCKNIDEELKNHVEIYGTELPFTPYIPMLVNIGEIK